MLYFLCFPASRPCLNLTDLDWTRVPGSVRWGDTLSAAALPPVLKQYSLNSVYALYGVFAVIIMIWYKWPWHLLTCTVPFTTFWLLTFWSFPFPPLNFTGIILPQHNYYKWETRILHTLTLLHWYNLSLVSCFKSMWLLNKYCQLNWKCSWRN